MSEIYEGNSITVNNINKSKAKIKIRGGSRQETTEGYNLLNVENDFKVTNLEVDKVVEIHLKANVTYTIKCDEIETDNTELKSCLFRFQYDSADVAYPYARIPIATKTTTYTPPKDINSVRIYSGTSHNESATTNTTFKNLMIYEGTENKPYEPYTGGVPSPNPKYPSKIENLEGKNKYYIPNTGKVKSYGITATYTKNTSEIILDGVATRDFSDGFEIKNILLKKGTYSVSVWGLNKINEEFDRFFVADTSNNNKVIVNYVQSYRTQKFTLEQDTNIKLSFIIKAGSTYSNAKIKIMINEGDIGLSYIPYNSLKIRKTGKNILSDNRDDYNGSIYGYIKLLNNFENNNLVLSIEDNDKSIDMTGIFFGVTDNGKNWDNLGIWLLNDGKKVGNSISTNKYPFFSFYPNKQTTFDKIFKRYKIQAEISKGIVPTEFEKYKSNSWIFPLEPGQKLYEGSYLAEDGIHNNRKQVIFNGTENWALRGGYTNTFQIYISPYSKKGVCTHYKSITPNKFDSDTGIYLTNSSNVIISDTRFSTVDEWKTYLAEQYSVGTPVIIEYLMVENNLRTIVWQVTPYTPEQQNAFYQLQNIVLYDGINHISTDNELGSMSIEVSKIIEDYETYISSNGFFINSQNDIHYLIDFSESELPCMAEATETTVKAAGRNGDIVLSTTYDPNNFNIVCYTEDNLTQEEKVKEEMKLKKLLNSIKNKTIPLAFEKDDKFYKVKYSGAFSSTNFPKHLKFSIPLKTSEAYGKDLIKKVIFGNGEETSDTFEDVGAIFTIKGPANSPIISLNDYSIEYDNPLLEGDKLIINSSNSTITHINSDGVKTNAMRYYNHQFPKIENGKNVLKVLSGVNEANVSVEWYDYKF